MTAKRRRGATKPSPPIAPPKTAVLPIIGIVLALVAITIAIYASVAHHDFVSLDDPGYVVDNPHVTSGLTWAGFQWAWTTGFLANWHPLTWLSHMTDVQLFGVRPGPHHLMSLGLHIANALLVFAVLLRLTSALWRSAIVAALFAAHPLHVESVAWISERKDVLSALFWLLAMWAYISYARHRTGGRYVTALVLFALGLLAKPMVITLPFALLLVDFWPLGRLPELRWSPTARSLLIEKIPFFVLGAASALVTFVVQRHGGAVSGFSTLPLTVRIANALSSYVRYLVKTLWPTNLAVFYPYDRGQSIAWGLGALILLGAVSAVIVRYTNRRRYLAFGWLWYVMTMLPVIGFVQVGTQAMADRYTYLPLIGVFIAVVWAAGDFVTEHGNAARIIAATAGSMALAGYAIVARAQVNVWKNTDTLWTHALHVTEDNYRAEYAVGASLAQQGKIDEAIPHLTEAIRIEPTFAEAHYNLGVALASRGKLDEAIDHYRRALTVHPDDAEAHNGLGFALEAQGKLDDALMQFNEAIRLKPTLAEAHNNRGFLLASQSKVADAIIDFTEAVRLNPSFEGAHMNLGLALAGTGRKGEAVREFEEVLRLNPQNLGARRALDLIK